jgi:2-oxoacid:acceptor oxidoreductase delta subunit (pyruvate/2-ketoisovalerate family)
MAVKKRSEQAKIYDFKSWRDVTPMLTSRGTMLHNLTGNWRFIKPLYEDKMPACQNGCPCGNDIEGWIKLVQKGEYEKAYWHLKREEPFPAILGRVCFKFCETVCNRNPLDQAVGINELERFVGDQVSLKTPHPALPAYHGKTLAIVGSGPAGMSAAYYARLLGFKVTIFEKHKEPGGILRMGIPHYRLSKEVVKAEFQGLKNMGIEIRTKTEIGPKIMLTQLQKEYDYLFLATGVHGSLKLGVAGEESPRVLSGLEMLKRVAFGEKSGLGKKVAVIGGGNTAIDAARTALRLGAKVTVVYRRTETEMPAHAEEMAEAREEGVEFRFLAAPEKIVLKKNGSISKLVCCEMKLGRADESGRRRPIKKPGAFFNLNVDTILTAIGETTQLEYCEDLVELGQGVVVVDDTLKAKVQAGSNPKAYAGGDIIDTPHTVVHAVAAGKKAAIAMDCDRTGKNASRVFTEITVGQGPALSFSRYMGWPPVNPVQQNIKEVVDSTHVVYDYFQKAAPATREAEAAQIRKKHLNAYRRTFKRAPALEEAGRCLHCGRCTECDNCLIFCPDMSVLVRNRGEFGYAFDYDYCKGCGVCFTECPRHAITMVEEGLSSEEGK